MMFQNIEHYSQLLFIIMLPNFDYAQSLKQMANIP